MAHVTAPLIGVRDAQGTITYLHAGAEIPARVGADEIKRLVGIGLARHTVVLKDDGPTEAPKRTAAK